METNTPAGRNKPTRGQGVEGEAFPALRLLGERLCLHFANTIESRIGPEPEDFLRGYPDLVRWGRHVGVVTAAEADRLLAEADGRPADAAAAFERAMVLRDAIYRIFLAVAHGRAPEAGDLEALRRTWLEAMGQSRLVATDGGIAWAPAEEDAGLDRVIWPVARSAVELLTSEDLGRVKECPGAGDCGWLFLDTSKNGTRRWCSMEGCGSRVKMRRQYARRRGKPAPGERPAVSS